MAELEPTEKWRALQLLRESEVALILSRFSARLAHEIGTPLNIITGHASMISSLDAAGQQNASKKIVEQANRVAAMVREALAAVAVPPRPREPLLLGALVEQAAAIVESESEITPALAACRVRGDAGQLLFAFVALAKGGGRMRLETTALALPPDVPKPTAGFVCLTVTSAATSPTSTASWISQLDIAAAQRVLREHAGFLVSANGVHRACLPIEEN